MVRWTRMATLRNGTVVRIQLRASSPVAPSRPTRNPRRVRDARCWPQTTQTTQTNCNSNCKQTAERQLNACCRSPCCVVAVAVSVWSVWSVACFLSRPLPTARAPPASERSRSSRTGPATPSSAPTGRGSSPSSPDRGPRTDTCRDSRFFHSRATPASSGSS